MIDMLFASQLTTVKNGADPFWIMFMALVQTCAQVIGIELNFRSISSIAASWAFFTISADSMPFSAYFLMEPSAHPMYFSIFLAMLGAASRTEFSSSPRSAPDPIAWVNWTMAPAAAPASVPPITNCLLIDSTKAISSSWFLKALLAFKPRLAIPFAVLSKDALERCAEA